jgi:hypothetical protein
MDNSLSLTSLKPELLVRLLRQSGSRLISEETLAEDIAAGAPQNPDGTFNLITYTAWLAKETDDAAN